MHHPAPLLTEWQTTTLSPPLLSNLLFGAYISYSAFYDTSYRAVHAQPLLLYPTELLTQVSFAQWDRRTIPPQLSTPLRAFRTVPFASPFFDSDLSKSIFIVMVISLLSLKMIMYVGVWTCECLCRERRVFLPGNDACHNHFA